MQWEASSRSALPIWFIFYINHDLYLLGWPLAHTIITIVQHCMYGFDVQWILKLFSNSDKLKVAQAGTCDRIFMSCGNKYDIFTVTMVNM